MFKWNVEDMVLLNQKGGIFIGREKIYDCENTLSREEKIEFIDKMQDDKLSYLLGLLKKFDEEKVNLKYDAMGYLKTVSLKAWLKRNDSKHIVDDWYKYGNFTLLGLTRNIEKYNSKGNYDIYEDFVDELFHRQLKRCEEKEMQHFLNHDEYTVLKRKIKEKYQTYNTSFGAYLGFSSNGKVYVYNENDSNKREITIEELKELLYKYEQLDNLVEKLTQETSIKY